MFNVSTIMLALMLTDVVCTLFLMNLWVQNRKRYNGTGFWAANAILHTIAMILFILRGIIPDMFSIIGANSLIILGTMSMYAGLQRFFSIRRRQFHNIMVFPFFLFVMIYATYARDDLSIRSMCVATAWLFLNVQCALLVFSVSGSLRKLSYVTGLVFVAFCIVNILKIIEYFVSPVQAGPFQEGIFNALVLLAYQLLSLSLVYNLTIIVNKRLLDDINAQEVRFSKAFHSSPCAIVLTEKSDGRIFEVNDTYEKITGYSSKESIGKTTFEFDVFRNKDERDRFIQDVFFSSLGRSGELVMRKKNGEVITTLMYSTGIFINDRECIMSSFIDITDRKTAELEREKLIGQLKDALSKIKTLSGMLPICASCKKIRNDEGYWQQIESFIREHSEAEFSHSLCPECVKIFYPDMDINLADKKL